MASLLRVSAIVFCLMLVMFFALKPEPEVPRAAVPEQVRIYLNSHDALRNQLAFGLFGAAALFSLKRQGFFNRRQVIAVCLIALLIPALEFAQIWMPVRHVDFDDVLNGWLGLGAACLFYMTASWVWEVFSRSDAKS
jgi:VanZ family protein